jgi:hypothetical protein
MKIETSKFNREIYVDTLNKAVCNVTFTKVDGDQRQMQCTRSPSHIPCEFVPKNSKVIKESDEVIKAFDVVAKGWRSFRVDSIVDFNLA